MRRELRLELRERDNRKIAIGIRVDAGIIVLRLDIANLVDGDENLAAALLDGNALGRGSRGGSLLAASLNLVEGSLETIRLDRLHQVVDSIDVKRLERILAVGGDEHHRRRVFELMERLGKLHAVRLGHRDVQEQHVRAAIHQLLDGVTSARSLGDVLDPSGLLEEEAELGTSRGFVVNDHGTQHRITFLVSRVRRCARGAASRTSPRRAST